MFDSFDATTVFFLAVAVFIVLRLRSVLGQRPQRDAPPRNQAAPAPFRRDAVGQPGNVIPMATAANDRGSRVEEDANPDRWKGYAESGSPLANGLDALDAASPGFDAPDFFQVPGALMSSRSPPSQRATAKGCETSCHPRCSRDFRRRS